jgi:hypothetical protein
MPFPAVARASSHPGDPWRCPPGEMEHQPGRCSSHHGSIPAADSRGTGKYKHCRKGTGLLKALCAGDLTGPDKPAYRNFAHNPPG